MAKQLQLRRGTATEHNTFTGANGEVTVDTTNKTLRVHDGSTVGGTPLVTYTDITNYLPLAYPKSTPPTGYLAMMGQTIDQVTYPILFSLYGGTLPDLRGQFLRGLDYGRGIDSGRVVLSEQEDDFKAHTHGVGAYFVGSGNTSNGGYVHSGSNLKTTATGGAETRPKNIAFLYIVKAG